MTVRWMLLLSLLAPAGPIPQDRAAEARKAAKAVLDLKDGDEEGFDAQADVLMRLGADALDPVEESLKGAQGEKAFRLRRVRDMLWYPIDLKGGFTVRIGNAEKAAKYGIELGTLSLSFNGQAVTNSLEYTRLLEAAEKAGQTTAKVELFHKGRRRVIEIEGLRMGGMNGTYPHVLAHYVHHGHRSSAWDEAVKEAVAPWNEDSRGIDHEKLSAAVRAGCRDTLVLFKAMVAHVNRNYPEDAVKLWKEAREGLRTKAYGGLWHRECLYTISRALLDAGQAEEALKFNEEALRAFEEARSPAGPSNARILRAMILEERDPAGAIELVKEALENLKAQKIHNCWHHDFLMHLLRRREQWDDVANYALVYGKDREDNPAPATDAHDMMGRFKNHTLTLVPTGRLYSSDEAVRRGRPDGLSGSYYPAPNFQGTPVLRIDPDISFRWGHESPHPDLPKDEFSVRWSGKIDPEFTDTYTFVVRSDDGARLWVDGKAVIDRWEGQVPTYTTGTVALTAGKKVDVRLEYFEAIKGAQVELYWDCPSFASVRKTLPWSLVYRHNFEIPAVRHAFQDSSPEAFSKGTENPAGKLKLDSRKADRIGMSWGTYGSVRVEMDVQIQGGEGDGRYATAGLRACLDTARQTEVGFGVKWPRGVETYLYFDREGPGFVTPWLDLRKPHRLALEVHQGRAAYFVDGKMVDVQFFPPYWAGGWGLRANGSLIEVDNVEVYVPEEKPGDATRIRALYDGASAAFLKKDMTGALASLEQAAALQPRVDELGRLYAAYLVAAREGRPMLDKRFSAAAHPQAVLMLMEAEQHLDLLSLGSEDYDLIRRAKAGLQGGGTVDPDALKLLKEASGTGRLALYGQLVQRLFDRGRADVAAEHVEAAYRHASSKDPRALVHKYCLAKFFSEQKQSAKAAALLKEVKARAPKAEIPGAAKDAKKP